jgi:hypothetical protein
LTDRGRGTEQVGNQPAKAQKIANQSEIALADKVLQAACSGAAAFQNYPELLRQRPVVVRAGNRLHVPPIAKAQAFAIDRLHHGGVGAAVVGNGDGLVVTDDAGHGAGPHGFFPQLPGREAVDVAQEVQREKPGPVTEG